MGITVLAALVMLGWMIVRFGANLARPFAGEKLNVRFVMDRADGVSDGSSLTFRGVTVGRVLRVWRDPDQHKVWAEAEVDADPPLPAIGSAEIRQTSPLGTGASLALVSSDNGKNIKTGDTIVATYIGLGLDLLPPELKSLGPEITALVKQLKDENFVANLNARVSDVGKTLDGVNKIVNDPKMQDDLRASMANVREASEKIKTISTRADSMVTNLDATAVTVNATAKSAQTKIDEINRSLQARLDQASTALEQIGQVTAKINAGTGTAGKLVNDPKLYAGLVDSTTELNATIKDLRRLIQQWEQEGVTAKLR